MSQELTKEIIQELMQIKGEVRGVALKTDGDYILKEKGKEGLGRLEKELEKLGYPIKYQEVNSLAFYPVGLRAISLLAIRQVFDFDEKKIEQMGLFAPKVSLITKLFTKYIFSLQKAFPVGSKFWRKQWTVGEMVPMELNEEKKYATLIIRGFNLHPIYCCYLRGYICGVFQLLIKTKKITCQETKCFFKGDKHHEYLIKWL